MTYLVKICGITNVEDALTALDAGADYLGLIFVPESPRCISAETAADIASHIKGSACKLVGVFQNADPGHINAIKQEVGLDLVQLHGQESLDACRAAAPAIKVVHSIQDAVVYADAAQLLLIDRPKAVADPDWVNAIAAQSAQMPVTAIPRFLLAGGLTADSLRSVIDKFQDCPALAGYDVASGVEAAPGRKDSEKVRQFCQIAKEGRKVCQ